MVDEIVNVAVRQRYTILKVANTRRFEITFGAQITKVMLACEFTFPGM